MSIMVKLFISALFSIHQYLPEDDPQYKKYFTDVRTATAEDIFPAAHETCRYLISVFVDAGLEVTMGSSGNSFLSQTLTGILGGDQALDSMLGILKTEKFANNFKEHKIDPVEVRESIKNICSTNFSPLSFKTSDRQEIYDFIQKEINVLSDVHLNSLGDFNYFGSVNIFDRSGENIGTLDAVPRSWVPYEQMSRSLTLALLATEDEDFFEHRGVDSKAIARILKDLLAGESASGGSTITMQLLKNMYFLNGPLSNDYPELNSGSFSTLLRKVREWYWAWPYEKEHAEVMGDLSAKKYVLEMYFNLVEFGPRIQGVEQASYVFFSKPSLDLDLAEAAFITTLLKAPSRYSNPDNYVEYSEPRRNDYILTRAGAICEQVHNTSKNSYSSLKLADTYLNMCIVGGEKIDTSFIELEKQQSMPYWLKPSTSPISTPLILVRNQVSDWIGRHNFDPEKKPKEISIQTTIDQNLQNIVFESVRKKLDEYDEDRNRLDRVSPAKDDTGRTALFRSTDIDLSINSRLRSYTNSNSNTDIRYFYSIKYRRQNNISNQTLDFIEISNFLVSLDKSETQIVEINNQIAADLIEQSRQVGVVSIIEITKNSAKVISFENFVNEKMNLKPDEKNNLITEFERTKLRDRIIGNALDRLYRNRPRAFMTVGVISENGNLINKDLNEVRIPESHRNRISNKNYTFGDFFWLKPESSEDPNGLHYLDTPKLQAAVVVMDSNTGEVLANFGGYDPTTSSFNRSRDAVRQAGSTLKPWIYFYALNKGFNPQDTINNKYVRFEREGIKCRVTANNPEGNCYYVPGNYSSGLNGNIAFFQSLANSQNIGTYSLIQNPIWGPTWQENLKDLQNFFLQVGLYSDVSPEVTVILGSKDISIEKLTSSFSFFANGKHIANPQFIKYITDYKGETLYDFQSSFTDVPRQKNESIFQIQTMMAETTNSGTAGKINKWVKELSEGKYNQTCYNDVIGSDKQTCFGGKTGTSNDAKDVWFIGFTKNFVIGTWIGYDDPQSIGSQSTGGGLALPIFQEIVAQGEAYLPKIEPFITPDMVPNNLERRTVYGTRACSNGSGESFVIYSAFDSSSVDCYSGNPPAPLTQSTEQQPAENLPTPELTDNFQNRCECVQFSNGGYGVNIFYDSQNISNQIFYDDLRQCERLKGQIKSTRGIYLCQ